MLYKKDFPIFDNYKELHYLDHAATSHKPASVIEGLKSFYENSNGSPHRGAHNLSIEATEIYQNARMKVKDFLNAETEKSIVFTKNTTEAINLLAMSFLEKELTSEDEILLSITNHHSNILPYQRLAKLTGAKLKYMYCDDQGLILDKELDKINEKTKVVAIPYISNGIGTRHNVDEIFKRADEVAAYKVLDAAQGVGHEVIDIQKLQADFLVFSGHKMYAPQGIGVLYGRLDLLEKFDPFLMGGDMIEYVTEEDSSYADVPERLEAGTQNVAAVKGLSLSIDYINSIGLENIQKHEIDCINKTYNALSALDFIDVYGPSDLTKRGGLITFNVKDVHPHDVSSILNNRHVAIRGGHHCCQPLMHHMKLPSTCRVSFGIYTTDEDIQELVEGLKEVNSIFHG